MLNLQVTKRFSALSVELDLQIPTQGITMIFGRSGAGKSSLLNMVSGLSTPDNGRITLQDRVLVDTAQRINLPVEKRQIGYVFQDARLFPHYRVKGNLQYGMPKAAAHKFSAIVELLGLEHLLDRYPLTLSGGEKQRVAIGRALLSNPQLLLMDEPLSALDMPRKQELMRYLLRLVKEIEIPILYVTHSLEELKMLANRVILLEEGKLVEFADLETVWNSGLLAEWQQNQTTQWIYQGELSEKLPELQQGIVQVGSQRFCVTLNKDYPLGEILKITIHQQDLFLTTTPLKDSSVVNSCVGVVESIVSTAEQTAVKVKIDENINVTALINSAVAQQLQLIEKQQVYLNMLHIHLLAY
ncbi:molybdenum ABC transporter ATP-binding protein [Gallibacterium salpingitidis]|uniref:molybdenum ABC transporter ATP-binding protein n=1 Tax=Gallibacterium salpingitidis TaxID=505341 RepID=UPI00266ED9D4|nr:molybdenum ABC transporter ATP-binding protein [Gallibacterium salpingitidis]WKT00901.1 molybdenum ABC transporter ATP-binding protein [Gallibacterium salpingitidis]